MLLRIQSQAQAISLTLLHKGLIEGCGLLLDRLIGRDALAGKQRRDQGDHH